jgi:hypothetical protein
MNWTRHVEFMGEVISTWNDLEGPTKRNWSLERPRRRVEDNIKIGPRKIWREIVDQTQVANNRVWWRTFRSTVKNILGSIKAENFLAGWITLILYHWLWDERIVVCDSYRGCVTWNGGVNRKSSSYLRHWTNLLPLLTNHPKPKLV